MALVTDPTVRAAKETLRKFYAGQRREAKAKREPHKNVEGHREERIQLPVYRKYVGRLPCCIGWGCGGRTEAAHLRFTNPAVGRQNPGLGRKSHDYFITPLCTVHHRDQHNRGNEQAWWAAWGINPDDLAAELYADFEAGAEHGVEIVMRFRAAASKALASGKEQVAASTPAKSLGGPIPSSPFPNRKESNRG